MNKKQPPHPKTERKVASETAPHAKPAVKKSELSALPLGGLGEIGMNMMLYECDGDIIVVDTGITFPDTETPGVDVVLPDTKYLRDNIKKLRGVFITHVHEDHIGAIAYLWDELGNVPVYVSPFAKCVLDDKLGQQGLKAGTRAVVTTEGKRYKAGCFEVEYVNITHSVAEGNALAIYTPHGIIFHTADFKFDHNPVIGLPSNIERMKQLGDEGVLAMLADSTNIFSPGSSGSEGDLAERLRPFIRDCENRLFFAAFASNIGRVLKVCEIAVEEGRKICFLGRTVQKMTQHAKAVGYYPDKLKNHIISSEEVSGLPRNKVMVFASGTQGEANAALSRLSTGENVRGVKAEAGDTVLMSSKMIPGNERAILNVINRLMALGVRVITEKAADIHVSGHASQDEIRYMYELIRPQIAVPVHGEFAHLIAHRDFALDCGVPQGYFIRNGDRMILAPQPKVVPHAAQAGRNYVDGLNILDNDQYVVKERRMMAFDGVISISIAVEGDTGRLASRPIVATRGLIDEHLQADLLRRTEEAVLKMLETTYPNGVVHDAKQAEEIMRTAARRVFSRERGKKPITIANIVEV